MTARINPLIAQAAPSPSPSPVLTKEYIYAGGRLIATEEPNATPSPSPTPSPNAEFVAQSVPNPVTAGQTYAVWVKMKNTGTTDWTTNDQYRLGSQNPQGNTTWGTDHVDLPSSPVTQGAEVTFSFNISAPSTPGTYNFQWQMVKGTNTWFGASSTNVQVTVNATITNVALASNGASVAASSVKPPGSRSYSPSSTIDGEHKGLNWENDGGWADNTRDVYPDWLEVTFSGSKTINQIIVYTLQNDFHHPVEPTPSTPADVYGLLDFEVQYWNGSSWVTVTGGSVTGNDKAMRTFSFTLVTTTKIRVFINNARVYYSRITELEVFGY